MLLFLDKAASQAVCILDSVDCSPHDVEHYINDFPKYCNLIYCPELHKELFVFAELCIKQDII